jgi:hypothetical protein
MLYLLVDARTGATASNVSRAGLGYARFSRDDIATMDFDIDLTPGMWDRRLHRGVPRTRSARARQQLGQAGRIVVKPRLQ